MSNLSQKQRNLIRACIFLPIGFAILAKLTYVVVDKHLFGNFYPTIGYWIALIVTSQFVGVLLLKRALFPYWVLVLYVMAMVPMLIVLQVAVAYFSGDFI